MSKTKTKTNGTGRTNAIVVAFDPGAITGFAVWAEEGLLFSGQGEPDQVLLEIVPFLKSSPVGLITVETAFLGKGAHASLKTATSVGFVKGALWASGVRAEVWEPRAATWRAELGFATWTEDGSRRKKRDDFEEDARAFAAAHLGRKIAKSRTHEAEAICMASAGWERWLVRRAA